MSVTYQNAFVPAPERRNYLALIGQFISVWWRSYIVWRNQQLAIAALQRLDNRLLNDIGIDRSEIGSVVRTGGKERHTKFNGQWNVLKWL